MPIDKDRLKALESGRESSREHTILIVDDEPLILATMSMMLEEEYEVVQADCGGTAMKLLGGGDLAERVSLIISDQRMPGMSGVEFLRRATSMAPRSTRVIMSGYLDFLGLVSAINEAHIHFYLGKPVDFQELIQTVRQSVEMYDAAVDPYRRIKALERRLADHSGNLGSGGEV